MYIDVKTGEHWEKYFLYFSVSLGWKKQDQKKLCKISIYIQQKVDKFLFRKPYLKRKVFSSPAFL